MSMMSYSVEAILSASDRTFSSTFEKAKSTVSDFERGINNTMSNMGSSMQNIGKVLSVGITAPLAVAGKKVANWGMDFEASMSEVKAISGATGNEFVALQAKAKEMGATTRYSASESAEGLKYMAMAGWNTQQMLDGLPGVMQLAAASGEDLGRVSDIVTDAMTAFGMEANEAGHFADVLAKAASSSNTNVGMLGESFKYVGASAGALGYSIEDVAIVLGTMANAGIKGGQAGTALRGALSGLANPTDKAASAMEELGINLFNADGSAKPLRDVIGQLRGSLGDLTQEQQMYYLSQLFGERAATGMLTVINSTDEAYDSLSNSIDNAAGSAEEMSNIMMDNLQGDFLLLSSAAEGLGIELYEAFSGTFRSAVQSATTAIETAMHAFMGLDEEAKGIVIGLAIAAAAAGPVIGAFGTLAVGASVLGGLLTAPAIMAVPALFTSIGSAATGMGLAVLKGMGLFATSFVGGITGVLAAAFPQTAGFFTLGSKMGSAFTTGLNAAMNAGLATMAASTQALTIMMRVAMASIAPAALIGVALVGLGAIYIKFEEEINRMLNFATVYGPQIIGKLAAGIVSKIPEFASKGAELIARLADMLYANIPVIFKAGTDIIIALVNATSDNASSLLKSGLLIIESILTGIVSNLPRLLVAGMNVLVSVAKGILDNKNQILTTATNVLNAFVQGITTNLPKIIQQGTQILQYLIQGALTILPQLLVIGANAISQLVQGIVANIPALLQMGIQAVVSLIQGIGQALPTIIQAALQIITTLFHGVVQALPSILGAGIQIIGAIVMGILQNIPAILKAGITIIYELGKAMLTAIPDAIGGVVEGIKSGFTGLWDTIRGKNKAGVEETTAAFEGLGGGVRGTTEQMATDVGLTFDFMQSGATATTEAMSFDITSLFAGMGENSIATTQQMSSTLQTEFSMMSSLLPAETQGMANEVITAMSNMGVQSSAEASQLVSEVGMDWNQMVTWTSQDWAKVKDYVSNSMSDATRLGTSESSKLSSGVGRDMDELARVSDVGTGKTKTSIVSNLQDATNQALTSTKGLETGLSSNFSNIEGTAKRNFGTVKSDVSSNMLGTKDITSQHSAEMKNVMQSNTELMVSTTDSLMKTLRESIRTQMQAINTSVLNSMRGVVNAIQAASNDSVSAARNAIPGMRSAGLAMAQGLASGISSGRSLAINAARNMAISALNAARAALAIRSPSRVFEKLGQQTDEGFAKGIEQHANRPLSAMEGMVNGVIGAFETPEFDIAGKLRPMNSAVSQEMNHVIRDNSNNKQPVELHFTLGRRQFRAFVEDISNVQGKDIQLEELYGF